jgi:hypothetical protein
MRKVNFNKVNPCNDLIDIVSEDKIGPGNAYHSYFMRYPTIDGSVASQRIDFQNGPINEVGVNGVTQEALLAILIDRLECFQSSEFACVENNNALQHLIEAQEELNSRTKKRVNEGTEGTHKV